MLTLYLVCLVLGGALLVLSLAGGGDADADVSAEVEALEVDGAESGGEAQGEGAEAAARFLSVRGLVFFSAFFGLAGTLFTLLRVDAALVAVASLALGVAAALAVHRLMVYLKRSESGALRSLATLAGARARVVVGLSRGRPGKVTVATGDGTQQLLARIHDGAACERFEAGDTVVIVRFQDGVALVAEPSFLA